VTRPDCSIVLHGHFYQPPREDPWTGEVPRQPSAAPHHDWNERIERECYGPIVSCRVLGDGGLADRRINALEWMSFNFGPTLLSWLERHASKTYAAIQRADAVSAERLQGHGNAIAMPYHHPILPLSTERDRRTEVRWGIADFRRRFGRRPEGMWLPETAVDGPTLETLAAEGIRFTILAPHQVDAVPADGRPARFVTGSGREIALFVYDGALSHGIAFGDLLQDGVAWADSMVEGSDGSALRAVATDGETFGHHHRFGEMALAKAVDELRGREGVRIENFASFLAREGVGPTVGLIEPSAWSCAHGVERWRADCGCRLDPSAGTRQHWRAPLRRALEWLADEIHGVFEREGAAHFDDPWAARDAYGWIVDTPASLPSEAFVAPSAVPADVLDALDLPLERRAFELLELERNALRLFTSCAWFFDDVGGLEARQVLSYAARAIELAGGRGEALRAGFLRRLAGARSNDQELGTAADLFRSQAEERLRSRAEERRRSQAEERLRSRPEERDGSTERAP